MCIYWVSAVENIFPGRNRLGFPGNSVSKESACSAGDLGSILGSGRFLKKGMATHSSNLAWRIPWTEEPGKLQLTGSERVRHDWTTNIITLHCAIALACQDFYFLVFLPHLVKHTIQQVLRVHGTGIKTNGQMEQNQLPRNKLKQIWSTNIWQGSQEYSVGKGCAKLLQSCLKLCDSMDCSLPGSSVHENLQARIQEWVVISQSL